ncbi:MAG: XisI protein [Blastocatellia bacterium]
MDRLEQYRNIIEQALTQRVNDLKDFPDLRDKTVFDRRTDSYLLLRQGWDKSRRVHAIVVHLEILNGKIWVQEDWTEHGVAADLEEADVPKSDIVLGFQPPQVRPYTEYAAA